jgi:AmiR/NasT family two-component response regulator
VLDSHAVIGQATGIVMARLGVTAEQAFAVRRRSRARLIGGYSS